MSAFFSFLKKLVRVWSPLEAMRRSNHIQPAATAWDEERADGFDDDLDQDSTDSVNYEKLLVNPRSEGSIRGLIEGGVITSHRLKKLVELARAVSAEFVATTLMIFLGCGAPVSNAAGQLIVAYALNFGTLVVALIFAFESHSGAVFNPSVTLALMLVREISILRGLCYFVAQMGGSIAGAGLIYIIYPDQLDHLQYLATTRLSEGTTPLQGTLLEMTMTFFLVFVVLNICVAPPKAKELKAVSPFVIGGVITALILVGGPLTGASLNPARSFGPALINSYWDAQWVFWIGPLTGSLLAVIYFAFHHTTYFAREVSRDVY